MTRESTSTRFTEELTQRLPRMVMFRGLTMPEIRLVASISEELMLRPGEEVGELGEIISNVYVVLDGELVIQTSSGNETRRIRPGEDYGLVSLVEPRRIVQPVLAQVNSRLVRIPADAVHALMESNESIALTLWKNIARLQTYHFMSLVDRWTGQPPRDDLNPYDRQRA
ncbi:MAG: cyclic nucleotide-binding domain-containing protein [Chloroflexi bacterium]|nr:MAG: cyclic nucleotide-binding domain-containing protein [Chloroflexota bacterium]